LGGVEAFFVISSFFLVRKYWRNDAISVKQQFRHRIARLYPPYIAVLIVAALYALLMKAIPFDLVTHLLSAQNYQWMITGYQSAMQPMTAHTWTLSIEVWGGLLWLLLLKYLSKNSFKNAMFGLLIVGILYRVATIMCGADVWVVSLCPVAHFDAFASGSLVAIAFKEKKVDGKISILGLVGFAGIVGCIAWMSNSKI
jgi:peptidoglycan/LPS O-acetylase OafA/YrhL